MTPTWRTLWPSQPWGDPALAAIATFLGTAETQLDLQRADDCGEYPRGQLDELDRLGMSSLFAEAPGEPSRVTFFHLCALNALTGSCNASLAITVGVNALGLLPIYVAASPALRADVFAAVRSGARTSIALTERSRGSDLLGNVARAERNGDGTSYRLTGEKHLINGGARHDIVLALLRTRAVDETRRGMHAAQDFTMFALERACGLRAGERTQTLTTPAADISTLRLDGAEVAAARIVGREGDGFAVVQKALTFSRGGVSAIASGAASRATELAREHARERVLYGAPIIALAPIAEHVLRAWSCDLAAAAMSIKQAAACNAIGLGAAHLTACAKLACCDLAERGVRESAAVLGAHALVKDQPFHALLRDVWLYGVFDGTRHVMLEQIQWRLPQLVLREEDSVAHDLAASSVMYREPARRLIDAAQLPSRVSLTPPATHLRALAALPGNVDLVPLADIAAALVDSVGVAKRASAWDRDAGLRFDAAAAAARLEAVIAMVELGDPDRRANAIGATVSWSSTYRPRYAYAASWHAVELGVVVQQLALRTGAATTGVTAALAHSLRALEKVRADAIESLQRGHDD